MLEAFVGTRAPRDDVVMVACSANERRGSSKRSQSGVTCAVETETES